MYTPYNESLAELKKQIQRFGVHKISLYTFDCLIMKDDLQNKEIFTILPNFA